MILKEPRENLEGNVNETGFFWTIRKEKAPSHLLSRNHDRSNVISFHNDKYIRRKTSNYLSVINTLRTTVNMMSFRIRTDRLIIISINDSEEIIIHEAYNIRKNILLIFIFDLIFRNLRFFSFKFS